MPDIYLDVDTALSEVPVNIFPLTDDTDFKTRETAVAYNASGMDLVWNFVTSAGAFTQTAVTPTTSGTYDWTHQGDGMYTIEIPASGGASINNDTEGYGWFTGLATGVLPWRGPVIGFRAAALNDALVDGGDNLDVNVTQFGGTNATTSGGRPEVNTTHAAGTAWGSGAITAASLASNAITSAKVATDAIGAAQLAADAVTEIQSGLSTLNAAGVRTAVGLASANLDTQLSAIDDFLDTEIAAILADTNELQTDWANGGRLDLLIDAIKAVTDAIGATGSGLTAIPWNAAWDAEVQSEATDALNAYDPPTKAELDTAAGAVTIATAGIPAAAFVAAALNAIADAILDRNMATGTDSGSNSTATRTVRQALRALRNKVTISGGTATVTKEDDTTTSWTAATSTAAGDPLTGVDPT